MNKIPGIFKFLAENTPPHLAAILHEGLEVQALAVPSEKRAEGVSKKGHAWTMLQAPDGTKYKTIRIPYKSGTEPEYTDSELTWDLGPELTKGIGVSGWNWRDRQSEFFIYDFDSKDGHKGANAITPEQIDEVVAALTPIPWVQVQKSKGGTGIHVYVFLAKPEPCANHTEHSAMSKAILALMSAVSGTDLYEYIDVFGFIGWVWHKETKEGGFAIVKKAVQDLDSVPADWRRHLGAGRSKGRKDSPEFQGEVDRVMRTPIDPEHQKLMTWLTKQDRSKVDWTWDPDLWFLQCHTADLADAHKELGLRGTFHTSASGEHRPDINCFAAPLPGGGWQVRRFGKGVTEHPSWNVDPSGWTRCDFNVPCTLKMAASLHKGAQAPKSQKHPKGHFDFGTLSLALETMDDLGLKLERSPLQPFLARKAQIAELRDGQVLLRVGKDGGDTAPEGWAEEKSWWVLCIDLTIPSRPMDPPDDRCRALVQNGSFISYAVKTNSGEWEIMKDKQADRAMSDLYGTQAGSARVNSAVMSPWSLVVEPFGDEYPGGRRWNRDGAALAFKPVQGPHPTWDKCLTHMGKLADSAVQRDEWCKKNGVKTGADYLRLWLAVMFQKPKERLPYLFFYSKKQNTGKSTLHEALKFLFKNEKGYVKALKALEENYNGNLLAAVLCVVEEGTVSKQAKAKIKDWVTGLSIEVRALYQNSVTVTNYTHWIQCANEPDACPIETTDTRITMIEVGKLAQKDNKTKMHDAMRSEGAAFLYTLMNMEIPEKDDRMGIPTLYTDAKLAQAEAAKDPLERFMDEHAEECDGAVVPWSEFWLRFVGSLNQAKDRMEWDQNKVRSVLGSEFPRGKYGKKGNTHIGNLRFAGDGQEPSKRLTLKDKRLVNEA